MCSCSDFSFLQMYSPAADRVSFQHFAYDTHLMVLPYVQSKECLYFYTLRLFWRYRNLSCLLDVSKVVLNVAFVGIEVPDDKR